MKESCRNPTALYLQLREQMAEMDQRAFVMDAEARGLAEGRTQGFEQGHANGFIEGTEDTKLADIENLMASEGFSATRAMNALKVPEDKRGIYLEKLKEREESEAALA